MCIICKTYSSKNLMSDDTLQRAIQQAIQLETVHDQHSLLAALIAQGHTLTQSTLSRKLKLMGIEKQAGRYRAQARSNARITQIVAVEPNLLVLKTEPGYAQALAVTLDRQPLPGQAGTVAGDDTVFVAIPPAQLMLALERARGL
jgi:transcriptional regulator of arginine metabolism